MVALSNRPLSPLALTYHGVCDLPRSQDHYRLCVAPDQLRRHIAKLRSWGYQLLTFGELARRAREGDPAGCAALTFDDGLEDNLTHLVPVLAESGVPATVFVVSGWLGRPHPDLPSRRILTAEEVRDLHSAGVEIGGHTVTHADLSTIGYPDSVREQAEARRQLEGLIDAQVTSAAYPFGRVAPDTAEACRVAGYRAACRISGEGAWDDPFNLPRQNMVNGSSLFSLRLKRDNRYETLKETAPARAARAVVRRARASSV